MVNFLCIEYLVYLWFLQRGVPLFWPRVSSLPFSAWSIGVLPSLPPSLPVPCCAAVWPALCSSPAEFWSTIKIKYTCTQ